MRAAGALGGPSSQHTLGCGSGWGWGWQVWGWERGWQGGATACSSKGSRRTWRLRPPRLRVHTPPTLPPHVRMAQAQMAQEPSKLQTGQRRLMGVPPPVPPGSRQMGLPPSCPPHRGGFRLPRQSEGRHGRECAHDEGDGTGEGEWEAWGLGLVPGAGLLGRREGNKRGVGR